MFAALTALFLAGSVTLAAAQEDATKIVHEGSIQGHAEVGVTVQVKKISVGEDATVVTLVASFDSDKTNHIELNGENAFLAIGDNQRLSLRQPTDNRYLRIANGQSMEGDLVFPGRIPDEATEVTLVFNDGHDGADTSAPGLEIKIPVAAK